MAETNAEQLRRYRADAAARGLCTNCRLRFPRPGNRTCDDCRDRKNKWKQTASGKASNRAYRRKLSKRRIARRKAAGLCIRCGRYRPVSGYASCSTCLDKVAASVKAIDRRNGAEPDDLPCTICGVVGHNSTRHRRPGVIPIDPV